MGEQKLRHLQRKPASAQRMEETGKENQGQKTTQLHRDKGKSLRLSKSQEVQPCFLQLGSQRPLTINFSLLKFERIAALNIQICPWQIQNYVRKKKSTNKNAKYQSLSIIMSDAFYIYNFLSCQIFNNEHIITQSGRKKQTNHGINEAILNSDNEGFTI